MWIRLVLGSKASDKELFCATIVDCINIPADAPVIFRPPAGCYVLECTSELFRRSRSLM